MASDRLLDRPIVYEEPKKEVQETTPAPVPEKSKEKIEFQNKTLKDFGFTEDEVYVYGGDLRKAIDDWNQTPKEQRISGSEWLQQQKKMVAEKGDKSHLPNPLGPASGFSIQGKEGEPLDVTQGATAEEIRSQEFLTELEAKRDLVKTVEHFKGSRGKEFLFWLGEGDKEAYIEKLNNESVNALNRLAGKNVARIAPNTTEIEIYSEVYDDWFPITEGFIKKLSQGSGSEVETTLAFAGAFVFGALGAKAGLLTGPGAVAASPIGAAKGSAFGAALGSAVGTYIDALWNADKIKEEMTWEDTKQTLANSLTNAAASGVMDLAAFGVGRYVLAPGGRLIKAGLNKTGLELKGTNLGYREPTMEDAQVVGELLFTGDKKPKETVRKINESILRETDPTYNRPVNQDELNEGFNLGNKKITQITEEDIHKSLLTEVDIQQANVGALDIKHNIDRILPQKTLQGTEVTFRDKFLVGSKEYAKDLHEAYVKPHLPQKREKAWSELFFLSKVNKKAEELVEEGKKGLKSKQVAREIKNLMDTYKKSGGTMTKEVNGEIVEATEAEMALKLLAHQDIGHNLVKEVKATNKKVAKEIQERFEKVFDPSVAFNKELARKIHLEAKDFEEVVNRQYQEVKEAGYSRMVEGMEETVPLKTLGIKEALLTARNKDLKKGNEAKQDAFDFFLGKIDNLTERAKQTKAHLIKQEQVTTQTKVDSKVLDASGSPVSVTVPVTKTVEEVHLDLEYLLELRQIINSAKNKAKEDWVAWSKLEGAKKQVDRTIEDYAYKNMQSKAIAREWLELYEDANKLFGAKEQILTKGLTKKLMGESGSTITVDQMEEFFLNSAGDVTDNLMDIKRLFKADTRRKIERAVLQSIVTKNSNRGAKDAYRDYGDYPKMYEQLKDIDFVDERTIARVGVIKELAKVARNDRELSAISLGEGGSKALKDVAAGYTFNPIASVKWNLMNNTWLFFKDKLHSARQAQARHAVKMLGKAFKNVNSKKAEEAFVKAFKEGEERAVMMDELGQLRKVQAENLSRTDVMAGDIKQFGKADESSQDILGDNIENFMPKAYNEMPLDRKAKAGFDAFDAEEALEPTKVNVRGQRFVTLKREGENLTHLVSGEEIKPVDLISVQDSRIFKNREKQILQDNLAERLSAYKGIRMDDGRVFIFDKIFN